MRVGVSECAFVSLCVCVCVFKGMGMGEYICFCLHV